MRRVRREGRGHSASSVVGSVSDPGFSPCRSRLKKGQDRSVGAGQLPGPPGWPRPPAARARLLPVPVLGILWDRAHRSRTGCEERPSSRPGMEPHSPARCSRQPSSQTTCLQRGIRRFAGKLIAPSRPAPLAGVTIGPTPQAPERPRHPRHTAPSPTLGPCSPAPTELLLGASDNGMRG